MPVVVVTGVTGKSGQCFLQRVIRQADQLVDYSFRFVCCKGEANTNELLLRTLSDEHLSAKVMEADLRHIEDLDAVFDTSVDVLLHIAGVHFSLNVVKKALENGVKNLIVVHTTGIYSKYKAAGEGYRQIEMKIAAMIEACRAKGQDVSLTVLRPTMIYGDLNDRNISTFIRMVDKLRVFPVVNGARYDLQPVWCKDLGDAYYDVLTNLEVTKNKEYILSGGAPIQLREMFIEMAKQLGVKNTFISCPFPIAYFGAWVVFLCTFGKMDFREKVQRLVEPRAFSHEDAARDFGYAPAAFPEGVREEIEMYKQSKKD